MKASDMVLYLTAILVTECISIIMKVVIIHGQNMKIKRLEKEFKKSNQQYEDLIIEVRKLVSLFKI